MNAAKLRAGCLLIAAAACGPSSSNHADPQASGAGASPAAIPEHASPSSQIAMVSGRGPTEVGAFPAVIVLQPDPPQQLPITGEAPIMDQYGTTFEPSVLLARTGQEVEFFNGEQVVHNVRAGPAGSADTLFNVSTMPLGSFRYAFREDGAYLVTCDVHPTMVAYVYAASSPYAVVADPDGSFSIDAVPYGGYTARVWTVGMTAPREVHVEISEPRARIILEPGGS